MKVQFTNVAAYRNNQQSNSTKFQNTTNSQLTTNKSTSFKGNIVIEVAKAFGNSFAAALEKFGKKANKDPKSYLISRDINTDKGVAILDFKDGTEQEMAATIKKELIKKGFSVKIFMNKKEL